MRRVAGVTTLLMGALAAVAVSTGSGAAAVPSAGAARTVDESSIRVIVEVADGVDPGRVADDVRADGGQVKREYSRVMDGFAADVTAGQVQELFDHPGVTSVRADSRVALASVSPPATRSVGTTVQGGPSWGLDRIDQRELPRDSSYSYDASGSGVTAYIIDSGITVGHPEFDGRAISGIDYIDGTGIDCVGHGTHVAGIIGGSRSGVAKEVALVSVRAMDCSGTGWESDVIAGIDWVVQHRTGPAVINLSIGGDAWAPIDEAVARATDAGVTVVAAAGNENADACGTSPARAEAAITVGSVTTTDTRSSFSNFGSCVDVFAPGSAIPSTNFQSFSQRLVLSGTSMAAPHVSGTVALYLQERPGASVAQVTSAVLGTATRGIVIDARSTRNNLVFTRGFNTLTMAPGQPRAVRVDRGNGTATVRWTPPASAGSSAVVGYRIRRFVGSSTAAVVTVTVGPSLRSLLVSGLRNGAPVSFDVSAVSAAGNGVVSRTSTVVPAGPPGLVRSVRVVGGPRGGPVTARVSWIRPASDGGVPVTSYRVTVLRVNARGIVMARALRSVPGDMRMTRVVELGLPRAGRYRFAVRAVNQIGPGSLSALSGAVPAR